MFSALKNLFGSQNEKIIKKLRKEVELINALEPDMEKLSDPELKNKTAKFKKRLAAGESLEDIKHEAFALVREASKRTLGLRHFDVQLIGGLVLHGGAIAEMRTGEGKTLVATLPLYLNALTGKGAHLVTVNDYLVARDGAWMGKIYEFLGLSVGIVTSGVEDSERKKAYAADITFAANNELGFDYLRDNMKYDSESKVQRPPNFAVVDEVDSIFIDEARTPLIISGPADDFSDLYMKIYDLIKGLKPEDYETDEKARTCSLTESGINFMESSMKERGIIRENSGLYDFENLYLVHYVNQALKAERLFKRDVHYLVKDQKIMIVDEFTGRVMDGRRYSEGLHQALEAKENVPVRKENQTLASITFQNYFRTYPKLSGMTGTAATEAAELKDIYGLDVVVVPTHTPSRRVDLDDEIYGSRADMYEATLKLVKERHALGQPILVGTVSIEKSEEISEIFKRASIKHNVLNAKFHEMEAHIIAQAGRFGAVTIATNMAGRGTDIMLGGNPDMLLQDSIKDGAGEKEYEKARAKILKSVLEEKEKVIKAGGLFVIGVERHESRRIDNQLRGRSGRQGDVGETKFFLSLDDDLMRIFASEKVTGILRGLGLKDGEAIKHSMVTRSLEKAQQKVEAHNYEIRKNLLKFDDVMNKQRKIIYGQRNDFISSEDLSNFFHSSVERLAEEKVQAFVPTGSYRENWDLEGLASECSRIFALRLDAGLLKESDIDEKEIGKKIIESSKSLYEAKLLEYGVGVVSNALKYIALSSLDQVWKEHLHHLDHLRGGINLRAYGQKDPLSEYKREAFFLFEGTLSYFSELFVQRSSHLRIDTSALDGSIFSERNEKLKNLEQTRDDPALDGYGLSVSTKLKPFKSYVEPSERDPADPETWGKISRNETCPCGSGKKYKHCHGMLK